MNPITQIFNDIPNAFDVLRIIAQDEGKLTEVDRAAVRNAADELEASERAHLATLAELIETRGRLIAVNDRLIELLAAHKSPVSPVMGYSTGWQEVLVTQYSR